MNVKQKERDLISIDEEYLMLKLCKASLFPELICCFDLKLLFFSEVNKEIILYYVL